MTLDEDFHAAHDDAWKRLTNTESIELSFHDNLDEIPAPVIDLQGKWKKSGSGLLRAKIMSKAANIEVLKDHKIADDDLVLLVRVPAERAQTLRTFPDREAADAAYNESPDRLAVVSLVLDPQLSDVARQIDTVCESQPDAPPTNPGACGQSNGEGVPEQLAFHMAIQRDLMRGAGFYETLCGHIVDFDSEEDENRLREALAAIDLEEDNDDMFLPKKLPVFDMMALPDGYLEELMKEIEEDVRRRFIEYMSHRPLGLAIITAVSFLSFLILFIPLTLSTCILIDYQGPGFGKTTVMAVAAISMALTFGSLYASAPTHVAVDNYAARIARVDESLVSRLNEGLDSADPNRARRRLIVRAYKMDHEVIALRALLERPDLGDKAAPSSYWFPSSKWKLHCSLTYWVLMVLGSPAVRRLDENDPPALSDMRNNIKGHKTRHDLYRLATRQIQWREFKDSQANKDGSLGHLLDEILQYADIVCSTPSLACKDQFSSWRMNTARAVAVDEAANMKRADLYSVWGNTMLPLLLGGDDKQLQPVVMSEYNVDAEGQHYLRHFEDARMSPLLFFKRAGWPIFRLHTQFRMANDLFGICHKEVYADLPFKYGPQSNIELPQHKPGRELEAFMRAKHPKLKAPPPDTLAPIFVNCEKTFCHVDKATGAKSNRKMVKLALDLMVDLVTGTSIDPTDFVVICPYKANVDIIEGMRKKVPKYEALAAMSAASTVDSFQGQEGKIVFVVMGTTAAVGPGFTRDENRLNVMFSRQQNGLVIFGDITVGGRFLVDKAKTADEKKREKKESSGMVGYVESGKAIWLKAAMLRNVYKKLVDTGRMVTVEAE